jgi:succinoglycan biosynthesis protein ExoA
VVALAGPPGAGPGPGLAWLMMGFVIPAAYLAGILGVTGVAARRLPGRVLARLPAALVTMHVCWGIGFLTSPRRLLPGRARSRPA